MLFNKKAVFTLALLLSALSSHASTIYDFTSPGTSSTEIGSGYGNALDFTGMTATSWATTGVPTGIGYNLNSAQILRFSTGLGACNRTEGLNCSSPHHQVDNYGDDDYILFFFDQQVQFDNIVIDPFGKFDRDVTFWVADISAAQSNLTDLNPDHLDFPGSTVFGDPTFDYNSKGSGPLTIDLLGGTGNALLFAAKADAGSKGDNDYFKISSLEVTSVIPVPAAAWLFGSGFIALAGAARRKTR